MDSLSATWSSSPSWTGVDNITGLSSGRVSSETLTKTVSLSTGASNNAANGSDEQVFARYSIAASSSTTIDLNSLTNVVGASISFARIKAIRIRLLSTTDDSTNGTAATHIHVGAAAANQFVSSSSGRGWLVDTSDLFAIPNGGYLEFATPGAAGVLSGATAKDLKITNGDASVAAAVEVVLTGGST